MNIDDAISAMRAPNPADYPELAGYTRDQIYDETIGGGALYLAAQMTRRLRLQPGDIVLDLGCGRGAASVFLARHFGVTVVAVDLWTPAAHIAAKAVARGYRSRIIPLRLDVSRELPFAEAYFDAIFSMNSFNFYGAQPAVLQRIASHLKPGGQLCLGSEVLSEEFTDEQRRNPPYVYSFRLPPPNEQVDVFADDFSTQHSPAWWRAYLDGSGLFNVTYCAEVEDAQVLYEDMVRYEHENNLDPFDVQICLQQFEWNRTNTPRKTLFTLAANRR